jgi:hypothetical protein
MLDEWRRKEAMDNIQRKIHGLPPLPKRPPQGVA